MLAAEGTITISYRGAGGYTIEDVTTFDGRDTVSNMTLLKISGPGLPESGVPLYDLNVFPVQEIPSPGIQMAHGNLCGMLQTLQESIN